MRTVLALALAAAFVTTPALADDDLQDLDAAVQALPLPSLQSRLRQRAQAHESVRRMVAFFGFGDRAARPAERAHLARNDR